MDEFIVWIYCWVDDQLRAITQHCGLRQRAFSPALSDAEVITMEIVGEFQGKDADKHIGSYFTEHWKHFFPKLGSRSQLVKQAINLWAVKQRLHEKLMGELGSRHDPVHLVDGFPLPVCHFKRAQGCRRFKGTALNLTDSGDG